MKMDQGGFDWEEFWVVYVIAIVALLAVLAIARNAGWI